MNILDSIFFIKKSKNVKIKKENKEVIIENNSQEEQTIIVPRVFICNKEFIKIDFKGEAKKGEEPIAKIVNRKSQVVYEAEFNSEYYIKKPARIFALAIRMKPDSIISINKLEVDYTDNYEENVQEFFKGEVLVIAPGYPSNSNKYNFGFVHTRVQEYKKMNWKVDVASVNHINHTKFYNFEDVDVCQTTFLRLRNMLKNKKYKKIIVHFFLEEYAQILDASDIHDTKLYICCHGSDVIYRDYNLMTTRYFEQTMPINDGQEAYYQTRDEILRRYNEKPNVMWIFGTKWAKERSESQNRIKYKNYEIIPCYVNEEEFEFEQKSPEMRKKIFLIRKYDNINTYSIDTAVRTILELSKKEFFNDLEFNIYGDGTEHDTLLKPLTKFENVKIYKKFLTHKEIAQIHKQNGIGLFPTRYETQGVSAAEAAMSGLVVITGNVAAVPQVFDEEMGMLCSYEDYKEYAQKIEYLYNNPEEFVKLSKKMHDCVVRTCGREISIDREKELLEKDDKLPIEKYKYKKQEDDIILTIAMPSYNVAKFLRNSVFSLINQELSNKIEVLIINDGSKDDTAKIGKELEELTTIDGKSIVKLIDKENGGHGSTINKGIELARGKYFKLMDGDDYFDTKELVKLIKYLENEDTDIILNNYVEDLAVPCRKNIIKHYEFMTPGVQYDIEDLCYPGYGFTKWGPLLSTSTFRTQMLKDANFKISENCFYVDMELNTFAFINAKTVKYYPLDIYVYYIGRVGQSISRDSYTKHYKDHETVTLRLLEEFYSNKKITEIKREYLKEHIVLILTEAQYYITTEYLKDKEPFRFLDKNVKKHAEIYNHPMIATKRVKFHRKTNGNLINFMHFYDKVRGFLKH